MAREDLIQFRRGTAAEAASSNPILASGEPGVETDTGRIKVGNGVDAWNDLPYSGSTGADPLEQNPIENEYADIAAMLADQANQNLNFFEYVVDASADPNVASGRAYYRKLATSTAALSDYDLLTEDEVTVIQGSNSWRTFRVDSVNDDTTPLTSVANGRIGFDYDTVTDKVTSILFDRQFTKVLEYVNDLSGSFSYKLQIYSQSERRILITEITSFVTIGSYLRAVVNSEIDRTILSANDRVEVFFDINAEGGSGSGELEYQTEITVSTVFDGTQKGLSKVYPVNSPNNITITIQEDDYVLNDVINLERRGSGTVEIVQGANVRIRGIRDGENRYFINDPYSAVSLLCHGGNEFTIIGRLKVGYSGAVTTTSYSALSDSAVAQDVDVIGNGFSANMLVSLTGNATLNSFTVISNTSLTLNITPSGAQGDLLTLTYDNGQIFVDTDAIDLGSEFASSLVAYYRLDGNSNDSIGALNGTDNSITYVGSGSEKVGTQAAQFINNTSYINLGFNSSLSFGNGTTDSPFSLFAFVNFSTLAPFDAIYGKRGATNGSAGEYTLWYNNGGLEFRLGSGGAENSRILWTLPFTPTLSQWYFLCVTYDGSSTINGVKMYIDGVDQSVGAGVETGTYVAMNATSQNLLIGGFNNTGTWHGRIDSAGISNKEYIPSEVTDIYNTLNAGTELV